MVGLNRAMMERYEIADHRPKTLRAALFGLDPLMLCVGARLLDRANELGGDLGAVCVTGSTEAAALRAQDGMFTLLVRGEDARENPICEERVIQSILEVADVETTLSLAHAPELNFLFVPESLSAEDFTMELVLLTRFLFVRYTAGLSAPILLILNESSAPDAAQKMRAALCSFTRLSTNAPGFLEWLRALNIQSLLVDSLYGELSNAEFARMQREMNYQDHFLLWAEPQLKCIPEGTLPSSLSVACDCVDFHQACAKKSRIFDALLFLCASLGFLCGEDTFAQVLRDAQLRSFIGHAFFDEQLPSLPWPREELSPDVISAFSRLENPMIDLPLLDRGGLLALMRRALLPIIRAYAQQNFDSPPRLTFAFSSLIMLYAGARRKDEMYEVLRGEERFLLRDDPSSLAIFAKLAHDVPAETLAYAVLADRELWGADLREIDGLELHVSLNISAIQRVGLREALKACDG